MKLANPDDAIHFDQVCWCPPRDLTVPTEIAAVCESVDEERGVVTYRSVKRCGREWPSQPCEVE